MVSAIRTTTLTRRQVVRRASQERMRRVLSQVFSTEIGSQENNAAWELYHKEWRRTFRLMFGRMNP